MRRGISIVLVLLFWIGPLAAVFAATGDELSLPACCRRHGAHHCEMDADRAAALAATNAGPLLRAPSSCPFFPRNPAVLSGTVIGLIATATGQRGVVETAYLSASRGDSFSLRAIDARSSRGPPATILG